LHIPKSNQETNISTLHSVIKENPFAAWTTISEGKITANHIPFVLDENKGEFGTLTGHVARANPIWKTFSKDLESVIIFQGDHSYITPSWYPTKKEHGKAVPTWNYAVVHAYGNPNVIEDREWLLTHVNELTDTHESNQKQPWKVSDAPDEYINKLVKAIVGIEIPINRLVGKIKLGQNRSKSDQLGMVEGLSNEDSSQARSLANMLNYHIQKNQK